MGGTGGRLVMRRAVVGASERFASSGGEVRDFCLASSWSLIQAEEPSGALSPAGWPPGWEDSWVGAPAAEIWVRVVIPPGVVTVMVVMAPSSWGVETVHSMR